MSHPTAKTRAAELYDRANVYARLGQFAEALSLYDAAIALDPSNPMYFNNRAATLKRLGRLPEAIRQYEQIASEFPEYGKVFLSIGSTCIEMGDYPSAVAAYKKFLMAFREGKFVFNPIVGGISQAVPGNDLLETAFLTSINYLSPSQQKLATRAFQEAILSFQEPMAHRSTNDNDSSVA
ncbi:MAG: tetratricopeptide repeat protein [Gloeomargarita sp. SKYB31]|nr:tetratricopeptide repeat protein [Gloeomargarita sp. SKYB31]